MEDKFGTIRAAGGQPDAADSDLYQRLTNTQRRLCEPLGFERRARDVTPAIGGYLEAVAAKPDGKDDSTVAASFTRTVGDEQWDGTIPATFTAVIWRA